MKEYKPCTNEKLLVLNQRTAKTVFLADVILLEGQINYTKFVLSSGAKYLVAHPIRFFEDFLHKNGFVRIHRQYMVNPKHVTNINNTFDLLTLANGFIAPISRRRKCNCTFKNIQINL